MENSWNVNNNTKTQQKMIKWVRIFLSTLLAIGGGIILISQLIPLGSSYIKGWALKNAPIPAAPVPESYKREIGGQFAYWDPGKSYFENLIGQAAVTGQGNIQTYDPVTKTYKPVVIDGSYSLPMELSISTLGINKVKVSPNVDSYDDNVYNGVLKKGLAHFEGTPLPGDGGNSFIYGHSAVQSYFSSHESDPETIFTKLEDIGIGDEVEVYKDGETLKYVVRRKKIVDPSDFSILDQQGSKETLTLMTCSPAGIGTNRLVVVAERSY